jgi:hypothetical protein
MSPASRDFAVLFLIFNRPDTTRVVFEAIRKEKPKRLFVAADGPRTTKPGEPERCEQARAIVRQVDWDCEVRTLFRDANLGCRDAISSGIGWFFEHVDEGVILEDDCLPDPSFFPFCLELLERYRYDERVMHIGGHNYQFGRKVGSGSYYFSQFCHIWGWAGWKRSWALFDPKMKDYAAFRQQGGMKRVFRDADMRRYYSVMFRAVCEGRLNTWDYQLLYAVLKSNGLCVIPNENLVENIGLTSGTHTAYDDFSFIKKLAVGRVYRRLIGNKKKTLEFPLVHPDFLLPEYEADRRYFREMVYFPSMRLYLPYLDYRG